MHSTHCRAIPSHCLEIGWEKIARGNHAAQIAHAINATRPDDALLDQVARKHGSIANDRSAVPGERISGTKLQRKENHDGCWNEQREAEEVELWNDLANKS
jgi:hypothetical protein